MAAIHPHEQSIFEIARKIDSPEAREAYLQQICGNDAAIAKRVRALLAMHDDSASFLESPAVARVSTIEAPAVTERIGSQIGPYKLKEKIGEGGMGLVFVAEQTHPVRRKVALKLIKPGMDTRQVIARFEAERQALALMNHANIAKVFDGGETPSGRPYFVMELVKGVPITDYCDENRLTPRARLELFGQVCAAVQHAHQKGIIHRDIKPTNVIVSSHDGTPVVKVIDFGVAKAIGQQLTDKSVYTNFSQFIGTPLYMSPEQAGQSDLDIDTRTDVYALGVLIYELLTGTTPFDKERLKDATYDEMRRIIREEEPPKPSTRVSTLNQRAGSTVSAQCQIEPKHLCQMLRGELDWVIVKALEKDRNRRYESASALAADVQRYLNDEPVEACPPSAIYRLRKLARRHKVALTTFAMVMSALLLGTTVSIWQAVEATSARKLADERLALADERRLQAEATAELMESIFQNLDPTKERQGNMSLQSLLIAQLDMSADQLSQHTTDPLTQARLQLALGDAYLKLGSANKAAIQFERSVDTRKKKLGLNDDATLLSISFLAAAYRNSGKLESALPLLELVVERKKIKPGADHLDTLENMHNLAVAYRENKQADRAVRLFEELLAKRKTIQGPDDLATLRTMNSLAVAYKAAGELNKALPLYREALEKQRDKLGLSHDTTLTTRDNLVIAYNSAGKSDKAEHLYRDLLDHERNRAKPDLLDMDVALRGLGGYLLRQGRSAVAEPYLAELVEVRKKQPDHWNLFHSFSLLGSALLGQGDYKKAEKFLLDGYEGMKQRESQIPADRKVRLTEAIEHIVRLYEATGDTEKAGIWREKLPRGKNVPLRKKTS